MNKTLQARAYVAGIFFAMLFVFSSWAADPNDPNNIVATPVFNPDGGVYQTAQTVVITCATAGATIRYTIDGSDPNDGTIIANGASVTVSVNPPTFVKARAYKDEWAQSDTETAVYYRFPGGSGTAQDPYQIDSSQTLLALAADPSQYNKCFILTADIDLNGQVFTTAIIAPDTDNTAWEFQGMAFTGTFDGNGHKIANFIINTGSNDYLGLFGCVGSGSVIRNLGVESVSFIITDASWYMGGLAGNNQGSINSCYSTGAFSGHSSVGGLVGNNQGSINSCYSTGTVSGHNHVGGLVGVTSGTITKSFATASVGGISYSIGGLAGRNYYGSISNCYSTGAVSDFSYVGGLVGENYYGNINNCYSTGFASGFSDVGGLIGHSSNAVALYSFWDTQSSGQTTSAGGTGKTTAQMKTLSTFTSAGWDFSDTDGDEADWQMPANSYPKLTWEIRVATPEFSVAGGTYNTEQNVTITCATPGATIRYTTDGCDPNSGIIYDPGTPIYVDHALTLKAKAWKGSIMPSAVSSAAYTLVVAAPVFTPDGGTYTEDQTVTITCATPGATIRYTIDGSNPSLGGMIIDNGGSIPVSVEPATTLKAVAWKDNFQTSSVKTALYRVVGIIYVNAAAAGANTGANWTDAYTSLQSALDRVGSGDEIWVAAGTYYPTSDYGLGGSSENKHFRLKNGVGLYGGFVGNETSRDQRDWQGNGTILSGDIGDTCVNHVFYHPNDPNGMNLNNTAILDGFTIQDGSNYYSQDMPLCNYNGGDEYGYGSGGGMFNSNSSPIIRNCTFFNNNVAYRYYGCCDGVCPYSLSFGAAMANYSDSNPVLINCVFSDNNKNAGGLYFISWSNYGSAIYNCDSNPMLINCAFVNNGTDNSGFNGYNDVIHNSNSSPVITNCIVWGNSGCPIYGASEPNSVTYSDIQGGYSGTGNINADPLFADATNGDLRLQAGSPCIDAGNNNAIPAGITTDLAGNPRFVDDPDKTDSGLGTPPLIDMGAYEGKAISNITFTPDGGVYNTEQNVVVTCVTAEATIHYTTDGLIPTESDPVIASGSGIHINHNLYLKARAFKTGWAPSNVKTALYGFYSGGSGTAQDPYQINSRETFLAFAADSLDPNRCYILTDDIDLGGRIFARAIIAPDTSPFYDFQGTAFTGIFDGNGHTISNFTIESDGSYLGLFGMTGLGSQIRNLGVESYLIRGSLTQLPHAVYGSICMGGLTGSNSYGNISNCYVTGIVKNGYANLGGLVGGNDHGHISNCYTTGIVSDGYDNIGGLVGYNPYSTVINCYSTTSVTHLLHYGFGGGLIGSNNAANVQNSFWDTQTSGQTTSAGGIGKTTAQMKTLSTFTSAGWDFTTIWDICEGTNYPRLQWQIPETDWVCPYGVNTEDLNYFVGKWFLNNCTSANNYCGGVDMDASGKVDLEDWAIFAQQWLEGT